MDVVTHNPLNAEPTWSDLARPITPHFFKRNHFPFPSQVPDLEVCGRTFPLAEILSLPKVELEVTLECAGNGRSYMQPVPPGTPWGWRGVSNATWAGCRLTDLLQLAPPPSDTLELIFQGGDGPEYARSLTLEQAYQESILVAYEMNGQPLTLEHGSPLRLLVPGWYAMASVKWLTHIRPTAKPFEGYYQVEDYQFSPPGAPSRPITLMQPRALPITPAEGGSYPSPLRIEGWAWSGFAPIESVRVQVGSQTFLATLGQDRGRWAWRGFSAELELPPGEYTLLAQARDSQGHEQPLQAVWNTAGYENNSATPIHFQIIP